MTTHAHEQGKNRKSEGLICTRMWLKSWLFCEKDCWYTKIEFRGNEIVYFWWDYFIMHCYFDSLSSNVGNVLLNVKITQWVIVSRISLVKEIISRARLDWAHVLSQRWMGIGIFRRFTRDSIAMWFSRFCFLFLFFFYHFNLCSRLDVIRYVEQIDITAFFSYGIDKTEKEDEIGGSTSFDSCREPRS